MGTNGRKVIKSIEREEREVRRRLSDLLRNGEGTAPDARFTEWGDLADAAQEASAGQDDEILWTRLEQKTRDLADAQESARAGVYGVCRVCGCRIPRRRLEAMPTAVLCVACQEQREAARMAA
jgi:DnaK suppressor protein